MEIIRKRICCYGWVQGVGFRWRAKYAASLYGATGLARNEEDGSVTLELQGEERQIDQVLRAIEKGAYVRIERMEVARLPVVPGERGFRTQ